MPGIVQQRSHALQSAAVSPLSKGAAWQASLLIAAAPAAQPGCSDFHAKSLVGPTLDLSEKQVGGCGGWLAAMQLASVRVPNEVRACERRARRPPWRPQVAKMHAAAEAFNEVTLGPWTA